eukprot:TRINITY_DN2044_c1_g1_i1.p1 TRINITY_DN2044_c1_g1~~TRINITY_DN2044_c1_g1_i1.p1  ORF type:complete len:825 (+),score=132.99 TRINITY_DN2044_c1_g1_i1:119-2593(+)
MHGNGFEPPCTFRQGRYQKVRDIGHGAYSHVMLVHDQVSGESRVIKRVYDTDASACNEVEILRKVKDHPNIVKFYDSFTEKEGDTNVLHIVMEYCEGGDLAQFLKDRKRPNWIDNDTLEKWFSQLLRGVGHLHDLNILHRDLKTANVFVTRDNNIKIADFGISRSLSRTQCATTMVGTPFYMAPEVVNLDVTDGYNAKSDVWSLGVILYELCALQLPFPGANVLAVASGIMANRPLALPDHIPQMLKDLSSQVMQTDASKRPGIDEIIKSWDQHQDSKNTNNRVIRSGDILKQPTRVAVVSPRMLIRSKIRSLNKQSGTPTKLSRVSGEANGVRKPAFKTRAIIQKGSAHRSNTSAISATKKDPPVKERLQSRGRSYSEKVSTTDGRLDRLSMLLKQEREDELRRLGPLAPTPRQTDSSLDPSHSPVKNISDCAAYNGSQPSTSGGASNYSSSTRSNSLKLSSRVFSATPVSPPRNQTTSPTNSREDDISLLLRQGESLHPALTRESAIRALSEARGDVSKALNTLSQERMRQKFRYQVKEKKVAWSSDVQRAVSEGRDGSTNGEQQSQQQPLLVRGSGISPRPTTRAMLRSSTVEQKTSSPQAVQRRSLRNSGVQPHPKRSTDREPTQGRFSVDAKKTTAATSTPTSVTRSSEPTSLNNSGKMKKLTPTTDRKSTGPREKPTKPTSSPVKKPAAGGGVAQAQPVVHVETRRKLSEYRKGITNAKPRVDRRKVAEAWMQRQDSGKYQDGVVVLPRHLRKDEELDFENCDYDADETDPNSSLSASGGSPFIPLGEPPEDMQRLKEENEALRKRLMEMTRNAAEQG